MGRFDYGDQVYYSIAHRNTSGRVISKNEGLAKIIDFETPTRAVILDMERGRQKTIDTRFLEKAEFGGARRGSSSSSSSKTRKARKNKRSSTRKN
jgi:hypothetical protein